MPISKRNKGKADVEKLLCHRPERIPQTMKRYKTPKLSGKKTARMMTAARASLPHQTTAAFSILDLGIWNIKWAHHSDAGILFYDPFLILVQQKERKISLALRASAGYEELTLDTERNTTSIAASA